MGRRKPDEMDKIRKAIAEILSYHKEDVKYIDGKASPESVRKLILQYYGLETTRQFVHAVIKSGEYGRFVNVLNIEDDPHIQDLKDALAVQRQIWQSTEAKDKDRTMAANSWRALQKQLIEYEQGVADIRIKEKEASRPIYMIKFFPPSVDVICPKCGHTWYDVRNADDAKDTTKEKHRLEKEKEERGKEWKPFYTKDVEEQKSFDDFNIEDKDEEIESILKEKGKKTDFKITMEDADNET